MHFSDKQVLSFDCYGTLIDWETGIWETLDPYFRSKGIVVEREALLALYAEFEPAEEHAGGFKRYREVLRGVLSRFAAHLGFSVAPEEAYLLADSVGAWPAFPDSVAALARLAERFKLVILSNVDEDQIRRSAALLGDPFTWIYTAERIGSYKPAAENFSFLIRALAGEGFGVGDLVHVAQSKFHDVVPALDAGLQTVWVNRRRGKAGSGATPVAVVEADLEVGSMGELVRLVSVLS